MTKDEIETPLLAQHCESGARIVDFAGFAMPLFYSGILDEHHCVRRRAGLFDVSHMGEISFRGPGAAAVLDRLVANDVTSLSVNRGLYTAICYPDGGIVDDALIYKRRPDDFLVIVNASNIEKDFTWFVRNSIDAQREHCAIENQSDRFALLALQGPESVSIWRSLIGESEKTIPRFHCREFSIDEIPVFAARTGYTGEDGFEILCPREAAPTLWHMILSHGEPFGIQPCGLGARDTLRLEARLPLYGQDIDRSTSPLEAGIGWSTKLDRGDFIGRQALVDAKRSGLKRRLVSLVMRDRGIARNGYEIHVHEEDQGPIIVGRVTSGTMSPTLKKAIALAYVDIDHAAIGNEVLVNIRGKSVSAEIVKGPFYRRSPKKDAEVLAPPS